MKKLIYLAIALCLVAGAVSCKKNTTVQDPENPQPTGKFKTVTITAGQGTAKTSISAGALTWSAGDKIYVVPQAGGFTPAALGIKSGAGSNQGTFEGDIDEGIADATPLYSYCGGNWTYNAGAFSVTMPATQTYKENGISENAFPSIGSGSIKDGVTFQNPFSILRFKVKGEGTLTAISVTSASRNLSGVFTVDPSTFALTEGDGSKTVSMSGLNLELTSEGTIVHIVVPSGTYPAFDITATASLQGGTEISVNYSSAVTVDYNHVFVLDVVDGYCAGVVKYMGTVDVKCGDATQTYRTVKIGTQVWFAENLHCATYSNTAGATIADSIKGTTLESSEKASSTPYYVDGTGSALGSRVGYYYNWAAAVGVGDSKDVGDSDTWDDKNRQGICPDGWHVPSNDDFEKIVVYLTDLHGSGVVGIHLKADEGWMEETGVYNLDCYGFYAMPAGHKSGSKAESGETIEAKFWTSSVVASTTSYYAYLQYMDNDLQANPSLRNYACSIRCLRNTPATAED